MGLGTHGNSLFNLATHFFCKAHIGHWADCGFFIQWVTEFISIDDCNCLFDELVKQGFNHIDALNTAAALSRVKHGTIDQRINRCIEISIFHHIARIFAAKLQSNAGKCTSSSDFHCLATTDRTSEIDEIKATVSN